MSKIRLPGDQVVFVQVCFGGRIEGYGVRF